jgi:hypothetical protein
VPIGPLPSRTGEHIWKSFAITSGFEKLKIRRFISIVGWGFNFLDCHPELGSESPRRRP